MYQIKSPADAANLVMTEMTHLDHEQAGVQVPAPFPPFNTDGFGSSYHHLLKLFPLFLFSIRLA